MTAREAYVMVVDDDPEVLNLVVMRLELAGYRVTSAGDAWQEVIQAQGLKIGLVITDIKMPGVGSGVDAYRQLRRASPQLPVIFITGMKLEEARKIIPPDPRARLIGKPINFEELRLVIKELTGVDRPL